LVKGGLEISERQSEILKYITENPKITRRELAEAIKINPSAIQKHIESLKKKGILKRIGPAKGGYWEMLKNNEEINYATPATVYSLSMYQ